MTPLARICALLLTTTALPALAEVVPYAPATNADQIITAEGDTLTYIGTIDQRGLDRMTALVSSLQPGQVTKLILNSGGGDTRAGMGIGTLLADLNLDITIEGGCFSSCADFLAPTGKTITIRENAYLGWHGNDRQFQVIAEQTGVSEADLLREIFAPQITDGKDADGNPVDLDALIAQALVDIDGMIAEEAAFFGRLGLTDTFAVCGVGDRFEDRITGGQRGWGFSIADMARLGLPPVTYEGPGSYEDNPGFRTWLILLTPEDCSPGN